MQQNNEKKYFSDIVKIYIKNILSRNYVKELIIVTFPHKQHFTNLDKKISIKYNIDIADTIQDILIDFKSVKHLNFSKILNETNTIDINDLWLKNDVSSHIKPNYHSPLFTKEILNILN